MVVVAPYDDLVDALVRDASNHKGMAVWGSTYVLKNFPSTLKLEWVERIIGVILDSVLWVDKLSILPMAPVIRVGIDLDVSSLVWKSIKFRLNCTIKKLVGALFSVFGIGTPSYRSFGSG